MGKKKERAMDLAVAGTFSLMVMSGLALVVLGPLYAAGLVGAALPAAFASFMGTVVFLILLVALVLKVFPGKIDQAD